MRKIPPLRAQPVARFFSPKNRFTGATHCERFAFVSDPDDRKFAALADAAGAALISNDDHLLDHRDRMNVAVLTPSDFWKSQWSAKKAC